MTVRVMLRSLSEHEMERIMGNVNQGFSLL